MAQAKEVSPQKKGGADISFKEGIVVNTLGQVVGIFTNELAHYGYDGGGLETILNAITKLIGHDATFAALVASPVLIQTVIPQVIQKFGGPPGAGLILKEAIDEWFDALREQLAKGGTLTQADLTKTTQQVRKNLSERLKNEMTFPFAVQFLSKEKQIELMDKVLEFKGMSAQNMEDWDTFWLFKLNKLGLVSPLLTLPVTAWKGHLESLFGKPQRKGQKALGILSKLAPGGIINALLGGKEDPSAVRVREEAAKFESRANRGTERTERRIDAIDDAFYKD